MKKYIIFVGIFLFSVFGVFSQGFDWQFSPRLPSDYPYLFASVKTEYDILRHDADLNLVSEDTTLCCSFSDGKGSGFAFGLGFEYWAENDVAYDLFFLYKFAPGEFSNKSESPISETEILETEYIYKTDMTYIATEIGAKYRLFNTHLHIGGRFRIAYLTRERSEHVEKIISPGWFYFQFADKPPSKTRDISDGKIDALADFTISPKFSLGWDISIGLGMYVTPSVSIEPPVMSVARNMPWKRWEYSFGLEIYRGIL